jgi:hypothetical protein
VLLLAGLGVAAPSLGRKPGPERVGGFAGPAAATELGPPASTTPATGTVEVPDECTVAELAAPGGIRLTGGDPTGRYLLGASAAADSVWVWADRILHKVQLPARDAILNDVNAAGVAVGTATSGNGRQPYAYSTAKGAVRLSGLVSGEALAINESGEIAGNDLANNRPVRWSAIDAPPAELPLPANTKHAAAFDLDDDGTVVGMVNDRAFVWPPYGAGRYLTLPPESNTYAAAEKVRNGWVSGRVAERPGVAAGERAVQWNLTLDTAVEKRELVGLPAPVNDQGWLAGSDGRHILLVAPSGTRVLPDLPSTNKSSPSHPVLISDTTARPLVIAGNVVQLDNKVSVPVLWTCT